MTAFVEEFVRHVRGTHRQVRDLIAGLDGETINWSPGPEMNSIAVIVTHALSSEAEVLQLACDLGSDRHRAAEFTVRAGVKDLLTLLDDADARLETFSASVTDEDLRRVWTKPSAQRIKTPQTSLFWLLNNYGHLREHVAHLEMTLQLAGRRR